MLKNSMTPSLPSSRSDISPPASSPPAGRVLGALLLVQILFGANYVISKVVVGQFPPLLWASARLAISTVLMLGFALALRRPHPAFRRDFFLPLIPLALLGTVINQGSFLVGLHYTTSTNSAVLNTLIPLFTLLIVTIRGQEPITLTRMLGFIFAFCGVLALRKIEDFTMTDQTWIGDLLTVLNCLSYALFLSVSKKFIEKHDPIWTTVWLFAYGTIGLSAIAMPDWLRFQMPVMTPLLAWSALYAILGATLMTYFLSFWALRHAKSSQVALFIYVQPVIASWIAWNWFNQEITTRVIISSALIFCGLLFATFKWRGK